MADPTSEPSTQPPGRAESRDAPVLLCYDGSQEASHAIHEAAKLLGGGPALVAHVWYPPSAMLFEKVVDAPHPLAEAAEEFDATAAEQAAEVVEDGARRAREAGFSPETITVKRVRGAWPALVEIADDRVARAVVVGSRGRSRVRDTLLGSVASGVVAHCRRPVLVVTVPSDRE
jgi:nucleotide-binding universal stress UspA family protein